MNATYSYAIIEAATKSVQKKSYWEDVDSVNKMKFTDKWVKGFLNRGQLYRRKITREYKILPDDKEIYSVLSIGQELYVEEGHDSNSTFNFDETAFTWARKSKNPGEPEFRLKSSTSLGV